MSENIVNSMTPQKTNMNPWLSIWFKPKITIRHIVDQDPEKYVLLLAIISGIYRAIEQASERSLGDRLSMSGILGVALFAGPLGGILALYLSGVLFRWTGSWLGGNATDKEVRAVYAWSSIVDIVGLVIYIPIMLIFGREWFQSSADWADSWIGLLIILALIPIGLALLIWKAVIFLSGLAEVHRFSIWKSLGATILGFLVVMIPLLCIWIPIFLSK